jgi:H+/Cl- antiporter ClcA
MIHIGAGLASLVARAVAARLPAAGAAAAGSGRASHDRDGRELVCAGVAAGMAAAFGAPVGGALYALVRWRHRLS